MTQSEKVSISESTITPAETGSFKRAIFLLPGFVNFPLLKETYGDWFEDSLLIAVDKGIDKAHHFENGVHFWMGDFDSSQNLTVESSLFGEKIPYPVDKDEIDTELAISYALEKGATEILLLGGIGGRLDHQAALLFLPCQYAGVAFTHTNGEQTLTYLNAGISYEIPVMENSLVSVIALTELKGLTLHGVKWELDDFHLPLGRGLTYSNRALCEKIRVKISEGKAWLYNVIPTIDDSL
ncbi:thiamine diphosphokinase [Ignatzschineria sp. LJL83]